MARNQFLYGVYERQLAAGLDRSRVPRHVGVILDGNRRWAKAFGSTAADGHRRGADKILEFLEWSRDAGVEIVTLWLLSVENLQRDPDELADLCAIIADAVDQVATLDFCEVNLVGSRDSLPAELRGRLQAAEAGTRGRTGLRVNVAVGYSGRTEIVYAVRELLREEADRGRSLADVAGTLSVGDITDHLYTKGQPDPDLVIRTSGEQRLSGFMLWQAAHSEYYFCEAYWPAFRRVDFLRALRDYAQRERRMGR